MQIHAGTEEHPNPERSVGVHPSRSQQGNDDVVKLQDFALRVTLISANDRVVSVPQRKIYDDHLKTIQEMIARDRSSGVEHVAPPRDVRKPWVLRRSFERLTSPARLAEEYESALRQAIQSSQTGLNGLNASEIADVLGKQVGATMYENIVRTFKRDSAEVQERYLEALFKKSLSSRDDLNAEAGGASTLQAQRVGREQDREHRVRVTLAFDESDRRNQAEFEKLEPVIKRKMRQIIADALLDTFDDSDLPFRLSSRLKELTASPPVPRIDKYENASVRKAVAWQVHRAGWYALSENLIKNGEALKTGISGWLILSYLKAAEFVGVPKPALANAIAGATTSIYCVIRDAHIGRRDLGSKLRGIDLEKELSSPISSYAQSRASLSESFGTRWVRDFETWARDADSLPIAEITSLAESLTSALGHTALLHSEYLVHQSMASDKRLVRESLTRRRGQSAVERYHRESREIENICNEKKKNSRTINDSLGIRCFTRFEGAKISDDAKKLHELLRKEPVLKNEAHVRDVASAFLREKYQTVSSYFRWNELEDESGEEGVAAAQPDPQEEAMRSRGLRRRRPRVDPSPV